MMTRCARAVHPLFLLVPVLVVLVGGCGGGSGGSLPDDGSVLIGRVIDSADPEQGIANAVVRVAGTDLQAVTQADGSYELVGLPDGPVELVVGLPPGSGYQAVKISAHLPPGQRVQMDITLVAEREEQQPASIELQPSEVTIGLYQHVHFEVKVLDANGIPLRLYPTWNIFSDGETPIGVISRDGHFISTALGTGRVVAQLGKLKAEARVTVVADEAITALHLFPRYLFLRSAEEAYLVAFALNGASQMVPNPALEWSMEGELGNLQEISGEELEAVRERIRGWLQQIDPILWWPEEPFPMPPGAWQEMEGWRPGAGWGSGSNPAEGPELEDLPIASMRPPTTPLRPLAAGGFMPERPAHRFYLDLDPEAIVVRKLVAGSQDATGKVIVRLTDSNNGKTWEQATEVEVWGRGTLTTLQLEPQEIKVQVGGWVWFSATALNQNGRPMEGLRYEWKLEKGLGDLELANPPFMDAKQSGGGGSTPVLARPSQVSGLSSVDSSLPGRPWFPYGDYRLFRAKGEGTETLTVTATDDATGTSVSATATIEIVPASPLSRLQAYPESLELTVGSQAFISVTAFSAEEQPVPNVTFEWAVEGEIGKLEPLYYIMEDGSKGVVRPAAQQARKAKRLQNGQAMRPEIWPPIWGGDGSWDSRMLEATAIGDGAVLVTARDAQGNTAETRIPVSVTEPQEPRGQLRIDPDQVRLAPGEAMTFRLVWISARGEVISTEAGEWKVDPADLVEWQVSEEGNSLTLKAPDNGPAEVTPLRIVAAARGRRAKASVWLLPTG